MASSPQSGRGPQQADQRRLKFCPTGVEIPLVARLRRVAPLLVSVALILGGGALAVALTTQATDNAESIHLQDRDQLQGTLGNLGKQYVLFSLKEGLDYVSTVTWSLRPGDPADTTRLRNFVQRAVLLNYGAALVDLTGKPLNVYTTGPGVPPPDDPGYAPMKEALLAGRPDVSSVMTVDHVKIVAMGVPIMVGGAPVAVFVGFVRLDTSALETYVRGLHYGATGNAYVVDSTGTVVAASNPADIGTRYPEAAVTRAVSGGRSGDLIDTRTHTIATYAPFGLAGWGGITLQSTNEVFGPLRSGSLRIELAIVALLIIASVVVMVLGHKRESARRRFQEQLAYQAAHDSLTGLVNRAVFHERVEQGLARCRRNNRDLAVFYLDLDLFKSVNDRMGHEAGDKMLVVMASRLRGAVRLADTVGRMGGDEFAILMEDLHDAAPLSDMAERIVESIAEPMDLPDGEVSVATSIGIAYSNNGDDQVEALIRDADLAMYRAKDAGGNRYVFARDSAAPATV
jgi:diguanylate cyclase (GGDEF)-like protein